MNASSAPLEKHDPDRARALKAKIRDRVSDVRRHFIALRTAMAEFGEDFDLEPFRVAYASEDPIALNQVKAVERGVDQLYNYIVELAALGLELAEVRARATNSMHVGTFSPCCGWESWAPSAPDGWSVCASCDVCSSTSTPPPLLSRCTRQLAWSLLSSRRSTTRIGRGSHAASAPSLLPDEPEVLRATAWGREPEADKVDKDHTWR
jgi:hypothetical protein